MRVSETKPGDRFKTHSGVIFERLEKSAYEKKSEKYKDRFKAVRTDTGEIIFLGNLIVELCN